MSSIIYTVGHSTNTFERLVSLLRLHDITAVADVRSQPYSRMNPQFNKGPLKSALDAAGCPMYFSALNSVREAPTRIATPMEKSSTICWRKLPPFNMA